MEINEGLNVVENWNSANSFIFFDKSSEISTSKLAEQEYICSCSTSTANINGIYKYYYFSTSHNQKKLVEYGKCEYLRAIQPLIYAHVNPYGTFDLDMSKRLKI